MPRQQRHLPRGIRNNNPLNIRIGNVWLGEVKDPTDPNFEQFISMTYGVRAAFVLMRRYIRHYHRTTIPEVIAAWAPATENNTTAYIDRVSSISGIPVDETLEFENQDQMERLIDAMIQVECGQRIERDTIQKGYKMA